MGMGPCRAGCRGLEASGGSRRGGTPRSRSRGACLWMLVLLITSGACVSGQKIAAAQGSDGRFLPWGSRCPPSYESLVEGPLRVRLFPGQTTPCLQHYMSLSDAAAINNYFAALQRYGLSGSWALMSLPTGDGLVQFFESGKPLCCYFANATVQTHLLQRDATTVAVMDGIEKQSRGFHTYGVCEWENTFFRHWQAETDTSSVYGATPEELGSLDRVGNYEVVAKAARRWKESVRGRMMMANGYGMLSHLAEIGLDAIGIETSETIPATQVKRAFARGAARQFGIPWFEEVSVWFGASVSGGSPQAAILPSWPDTPVGGDAGHSASHLKRHWFTSWFSGANHVMLEASPQVLFERPWSSDFPEQARLSRYGKDAAELAALMKDVDVGVPYTPFAVLVSKYHGRWSVWGKPWGRLEETPGDRMTERFFDQFFPGQSRGPGREERYLCSSPYGDSCDVVVNDADRTSWRSYPVILAVGDIPWTTDDVRFLEDYVKVGGVLALNEINTEGWDRRFIGLAGEGFAPTHDARAVMESADGAARLIRRDVGKGCVFVSSRTPQADRAIEMAFPDAFLVELAATYLPVTVEGDVQTLVNRTKNGWAVMVVNNKGIAKDLHVDAKPFVDDAAGARVRISYRGEPATASDLIDGRALQMERTGFGNEQILRFDLPPGELRLVAITM